jgi:two-component sensor histidine kinase/PAS domain-containing protein
MGKTAAGGEGSQGGDESYRTLFRNMLDGYAYCEAVFEASGRMADWRYLEVNEAFHKLTGLSPAPGALVSEVIPNIRATDPGLFEIYGRVAGGGPSERFEMEVAALGQWFSVSVYCPEKGRFVAVFEVITERKRAEAALRESEAKLRSLFQIIPVGLSILDKDRRFIATNPALSRILRLPEGGGTAAIPSRSYLDAAGKPLPSSDFPSVRAAARREAIENVEIGVALESGERHWVKVSAVPTPFTDWDVVLTVTDLDEQKRTEEELSRALVEKGVLLKELQHRVKNNLEVVASMLSLGLDEARDEEARKVLADACSRVHAMGAIYETLVYSESLDRIELDRFLELFIDSLYESYVIDRELIRFETRLETHEIDLRRAVSLGLALNELVTNALKYAYPPGAAGVIGIELLKTDSEIGLRVSDKGRGLPGGLDPASSRSMGLTLVRLLASQLKGRFEIESEEGRGMRATLSIPV